MQLVTSRFPLSLACAAVLLASMSGCAKATAPEPDPAASAEQASSQSETGLVTQAATGNGAPPPGSNNLDSAPPPTLAQDAEQPPAVPTFTADRLEQMVAPIALYPDPLLTEILMAATYPAEVTDAAAWVKEHPGLTGKELDAAIADKGWDLSINSLVHAPKALELMAADPEWTKDLGDAFLAQQDDVLNAVQVMRSKACDLGHLKTTAEQKVIIEPRPAQPAPAPAQPAPGYPAPAYQPQYVVAPPPVIVRIVPVRPDVFYVPYYNPRVMFGPAPPVLYYPRVMAYPSISIGVGPIISFGVGFTIGSLIWGDVDWHHHRVYSRRYYGGDYDHHHRDRYEVWRHDVHHRRGINYRSREIERYYSRPSYRDDRDGRRPGERDRDRYKYDRDRHRYDRDPREPGRVHKYDRERGAPRPGVGKPYPEVGKPRPQTGKARPEVGKPRPQTGKSRPEVGKPRPETGKSRPEVGKPRPEVGKSRDSHRGGGSSQRDLDRHRGGGSPSKGQRPSMGSSRDHRGGGGSQRPQQGRGGGGSGKGGGGRSNDKQQKGSGKHGGR